jgi:ribonuclease T2
MLARAIFLAGLIAACVTSASAKTGDFDFYVLSLSWSPTYCATDANPDFDQCSTPDLGFVAHGLWPEYEAGLAPEYCDSGEPSFVKRSTLDAIADVIPNGGFAAYEWRKHGMCTGLSASSYFNLLREAVQRVDIPSSLKSVANRAKMAPSAIEAEFVRANPGLSQKGMAVRCQGGALSEVRICFTKGLDFRPCPEVDAAACRSGSISVPSP